MSAANRNHFTPPEPMPPAHRPPGLEIDDPFSVWREEDEAKSPCARAIAAWVCFVFVAAFAAWLCMGVMG